MFWKNLCILCNEHKTTPNTICRELGLSSATATHWRQGSVPRDTTLQKIATHFGVTVEFLLRSSDEPLNVTESVSPSPLSPEFNELLNQMTLADLKELQAIMEGKIKNRKS